jgi:hypothetical protein
VNFPTRLQNNCISAIDNIFIDYSRQGYYEISPIYNGLSNYDGQLISIQDVNLRAQTYNIQYITKISKFSLAKFNYNLSFVKWEDIFDDNNADSMFNSSLNIFLRLFYFSFPKIKKTSTNVKSNNGKLRPLKPCGFNRDFYLITKNYNDPKLKNDYKEYCKILWNTIKETKRSYYNKDVEFQK